jgi:hypothetical protein
VLHHHLFFLLFLLFFLRLLLFFLRLLLDFAAELAVDPSAPPKSFLCAGGGGELRDSWELETAGNFWRLTGLRTAESEGGEPANDPEKDKNQRAEKP